MRASAPKLAFYLLPLLVLVACDKPDVGQRCVFSWNSAGPTPPPTPTTVSADYFETGNVGCENLVCIVSKVEDPESKYGSCRGDACGYCSKPCVSDDDCYKSETGLACRQIILDPVFIAGLTEEAKKYLPDTESSWYCVVPNDSRQ
jgi:hypothetical protein